MSEKRASTGLVLFQYTQPEMFDGLVTNRKLQDGTNPQSPTVALSLTLESRKATRERLKLGGRDNIEKLDRTRLELSDALKSATLGEFVKRASDPFWTGGRLSISQSKSGKQTMSIKVVSAERGGHIVSQEQLVKALAKMSEDEQIALMEKAEELKRGLEIVESEPAAANA
jgi:hypothetical protein